MPTVHMSDAEAARDLHAVLAKEQGIEVVIEQNHRPVAECLALAKAYEAKLGHAPVPGADFASDVQVGIDARRDSFEPPAWD